MSFSAADFEKQVLQRSSELPVLVDFWAPWCGPCRTLGPVLERLAQEADGRWELVKVNTEENQELAMTFNITSIPAVKLFVKGEVADEFTGALPEPEIRRFLDRALPSRHREALTEARQLLERDSHEEAIRLLEPVVEGEPGNLEARVLLAEALLTRSPERIGSLLENVPLHVEWGERAEALRTLANLALLPAQAESLPPSKARELYLAGAAAVRSGDKAAALTAFIEALQRDRDYQGGGARDACKAIFQLLGRRHPLSERFFRAFSSALHA